MTMKLLVGVMVSVVIIQGAIPWPPIGPDVTGGSGPAGHAWDIPAKACFDRTAVDHTFDGAPISATGASWSASVATISVVNSFHPTGIITVAGVSNTAYNGTFGIYARTGTTVSYRLPNPGGSSSGGTVKYTPLIPAFDGDACYGH